MNDKVFETKRTYCTSTYWKATFQKYSGIWLLDNLVADAPLPLNRIKAMMKDIEEIITNLNKGK